MLVGLDGDADAEVGVVGSGSLPSVFRVTDLAVASIASAGVCLTRLTNTDAAVVVDRALASHWFGMTLQPDGWALPPLWDAVAGDYETTDGWIRLHTNAPHHRTAALQVLGVDEDRDAVTVAVRQWRADELEQAIVDNRGAAAAMRSLDAWQQHPQGSALRAEPLIASETTDPAPTLDLPGTRFGQPLAGIHVLDLTRVLAGPVATRLLAGWGADVLRIDPPDWDEPGVIPEVMRGKRTARLDLTISADRERFTELLARADVLVHGYRPGALEHRGFGPDARAAIRPGLVDVTLDAYGWTGPWAGRRGFDSLVQMSSGIADQGMRRSGRDRPTPLPVQALDHATGYLMAAAALSGLTRRRRDGIGSRWRLSLARTAQLLIDAGPQHADEPPDPAAVSETIEDTAWGRARRIVAPLTVPDFPLAWSRPARAIGTDAPRWGAR